MLASSVWRWRSFRYFLFGLLVGGLTAGAAVAVMSGFVPDLGRRPAQLAIAVMVVVAVSRDTGVVRLRLPENARQVTDRIVARGPTVGALQFGFEMGTGMRTYITASAPYILVVGALLAADTSQSIVAGLGFGAGRGAMAASALALGPDRWVAAFERHQRVLAVVCSVATGTAIATF